MIRKTLPVVLQTEVTECGLACLIMIARFHGHDVDLNAMRRTASISLKGASLKQIMQMAGRLQLSSRPLRVELDQLHKLQTPAILHWDLNHFVVLKKIKNGKLHFIDPARGLRIMALEKVSDHFSGVALEFSPAADFNAIENRLKPKIWHLWSQLRGGKRAIVQTLILSIILQCVALAAPFYLQLVIDRAVTPNAPNILWGLVIGFSALVVLRAASEAIRGWAILIYGNQLSFQMVGNIIRHLLRLPTAWFEKRHVGDIISRIGSIRPIQEALTESVVAIVLDGFMAVLTLLVLFLYSPVLGGIVLGMTMLLVLATVLIYPHLRRTEEEAIVTKAYENSHVIESIRASTTIKLFGREAAREAAWRNLFADTINAQVEHGKFQVLQKFFETLLVGLQIVIAVYIGADLILASMNNSMTSSGAVFSLGMLFAFLGYQQHFTESVKRLLQEGIKVSLLTLHLDRLADIVYAQSEENHFPDPAKGAQIDGTAKPDLCFDPEADLVLADLSFRYSDHDPFVFEGLNLRIQAGKMTTITGSSGGGKTTLLKLILGLYAPTQGSISLGDVNISDLNLQDWRRSIGVVMQDDQLLSGTIADNISFFDPNIDMKRVVAAAKSAQIHDEILAIPMHYLSMVGDMGSVLSGGQKQRVLLARALYHSPKIIFLDEGTANLDPKTEKKIVDVLENLSMTRIIIAHRPEFINRSDHVIRLDII